MLSRLRSFLPATSVVAILAFCLAGCPAPTKDEGEPDGGPALDRDAGSEDAGSDAGDASAPPAELGAPCETDDDCRSPESGGGFCMHTYCPLAVLGPRIPPEWYGRGLRLDSGYCSGGDRCALGAPNGLSFNPFEDLTSAEFADLAAELGLEPVNVEIMLGSHFGYADTCLRRCDDASDCLEGQACASPLGGRFDDVAGVDTTTRACIPLAALACAPCDVRATCTPSGATLCTCPAGYEGDGETCAAATDTGKPCNSSATCDSTKVAACLESLAPFAASGDETFEDFRIDFPEGYCSTAGGCEDDSDCDPDAACFAPFLEVEQSTLDALESARMLAPNALDYLPSWSHCLRPCAGPVDCFSDQSCEFLLEDVIALFPNSRNEQPFCVYDPDCASCSEHAMCVGQAGARSCECRYGYDGDGVDCEPVVSGL